MKMKICGGGANRLGVAWDGGKVNPAMEMSHKGKKGKKKEERRKRRGDQEREREREATLGVLFGSHSQSAA